MCSSDLEVIVETAEDTPLAEEEKVETPAEPEEEAAKDEEEKEEKAEATEKESASLTEWDLRDKISRACSSKLNTDWAWVAFLFPAESKCWVRYPNAPTELDYAEFDYVVSDDEVSVSDPTYIKLVASPRDMSAKLVASSTALTKANEIVQSLTAQVEELAPFKESYERDLAEKEAAEKSAKQTEISTLLVNSGRFTEEELASEEIKEIISSLNENAAKVMIAERFMASLGVEKPHETAVSLQEHVSVKTVLVDEEPVNAAAVVMSYINKGKKR